MNDLWQRLKQRKLVHWAVAYVAGAFALLQGIDIIANHRDIVRDRYIPFFESASVAIHHLIASIDKQLGEPAPGKHPQ